MMVRDGGSSCAKLRDAQHLPDGQREERLSSNLHRWDARKDKEPVEPRLFERQLFESQ